MMMWIRIPVIKNLPITIEFYVFIIYLSIPMQPVPILTGIIAHV